jgi:hypothetical protein
MGHSAQMPAAPVLTSCPKVRQLPAPATDCAIPPFLQPYESTSDHGLDVDRHFPYARLGSPGCESSGIDPGGHTTRTTADMELLTRRHLLADLRKARKRLLWLSD